MRTRIYLTLMMVTAAGAQRPPQRLQPEQHRGDCHVPPAEPFPPHEPEQ